MGELTSDSSDTRLTPFLGSFQKIKSILSRRSFAWIDSIYLQSDRKNRFLIFLIFAFFTELIVDNVIENEDDL